MSDTLYSPKQFARMIGRSVKTLQKWDRQGVFKAHRTPTNRRYYTQEDYLNYLEGRKSTDVALHQD